MSEDFYTALAALDWQVELGADECIGDAPVNRFEVAAEKPKPAASKAVAAAEVVPDASPDFAALSAQICAGCESLDALRHALEAFEGCELKRGARNTVFADGTPGARVMIIGQAPGREEDAAGAPFVGQAGALLDKMFAAIGLSRDAQTSENGVYIAPVLPWRPPQDRDPTLQEVEVMRPFLDRHIALAKPELLVLMGSSACKTVLNEARGVNALRGSWQARGTLPVMPMFHPAALLRDPAKKAASWLDLQAIKKRLTEGSG